MRVILDTNVLLGALIAPIGIGRTPFIGRGVRRASNS